MEEEKKATGDNNEDQIDSTDKKELTTAEKITQLEEQLMQLKFDHDEKAELTQIFETGGD